MSKTSTILTIVGAVGVVVTAVLAAKAAPKAEKMLAKAEIESETELTTFEKVKTVAPAYVPAVVAGTSTIACILGSNLLNKRAQASLASAYALLDSSYKEYKKKVDEFYGEGTDEKIQEELTHDAIEDLDEHVADDKMVLFWDFNSMQYFRSTVEKATADDGLECYILNIPPGLPEAIWGRDY